MEKLYLPKPQLNLDYPLMKALNNRRTKRKYINDKLSLQDISSVLWAACGETQKAANNAKNKRTIPSACNAQKVSIYVVLEQGVYNYDEKEHSLIPINNLDIRNDLVKQKILKNAPVGIIYIGIKELKSGIIKYDDLMQSLLIGTEVGAMSQNVYLYCTAVNLNTVLIGLFDRDNLQKLIALPEDREIIYTQVIG